MRRHPSVKCCVIHATYPRAKNVKTTLAGLSLHTDLIQCIHTTDVDAFHVKMLPLIKFDGIAYNGNYKSLDGGIEKPKWLSRYDSNVQTCGSEPPALTNLRH